MSSSTPEARALALFREGRLAEARDAWSAILASRPDDPQALHMLGYILTRLGRHAEGLALMDRSIERAPRAAPFLNNRAQVLAEAGRAEDALRDLRRAVQIDPRLVAAWCHLGSLLRRTGRLEEALAAFRRAVSVDARSAEAHVGLGNVLRERGDEDGARAAYEAALAIDPGQASAHYNLGVMRLVARDLGGAEASLRRALEREPRNAMALNNLGVVARDGGRAEEALAWFERACEADPANVEALNNLGLALQQAGRLDEAIGCYERAARLRPTFVAALVNWGNALKDRGDLEAAADAYARALAADAAAPAALVNAASVALDRGRLEEAANLYRRAVEARPGWADAEYGLGQAALRRHQFARGWDGYERRFETDPPQSQARSHGLPRLAPEDLGKSLRVAVWSEQGVGDQILFSTLLPELARRGMAAVVEVDERLLALYRRNLPALRFTTAAEAAAAFAGCEREIPIGSLARLFRPDAASFDAQPAALLEPDPRRVAAMRERLGPGRWVGISWRSLQRGARRALAERKSIPLEEFAALAAAGVRLLDLQYGEVEAERAAFHERHPGVLVRLEDLDTYADLEGIAAAMAACERIVTASNVTAHLAGATGRPTQVVYLGAEPPFAYWAARTDGRCVWYPSVRILGDPAWSRWSDALAAVRRSLEP